MERFFMPLLFTLIPTTSVLVAYLVARRRPDGEMRSRILLNTGRTFLFATAAFLALILVGELVDSEGPLQALALMAPWLIGIVILLALALSRPRAALIALTLLAAAPISLATWEAFQPIAASAWADARGPIELIAIYGLAFLVAFTARREPRWSGLVLLLAAGVPLALRAVTPAGELSRQLIIASLSVPAAAAGVAFLLAARQQPRVPTT